MTGPSEATLIIVGLGTAAFMLAFSRIATAEAAKALDLHFLHVRAMKLRNEYARTILSMRPEAPPDDPAASPVAGTNAGTNTETRRAA